MIAFQHLGTDLIALCNFPPFSNKKPCKNIHWISWIWIYEHVIHLMKIVKTVIKSNEVIDLIYTMMNHDQNSRFIWLHFFFLTCCILLPIALNISGSIVDRISEAFVLHIRLVSAYPIISEPWSTHLLPFFSSFLGEAALCLWSFRFVQEQ